MRVTRRDVAAAAGTSPAVVSYVLNDGPRPVAAATRARVLAAVQELGYRPNAIARSLRTQRSRTLGLIVPDSSDPFFAALSRSIEDVAYERGYLLLVGNAADDGARFTGYLHAFLDQHVGGLAVIPPDGAAVWLEDLRASSTPSIVLDRVPGRPGLRSVVCDNESGAYNAVRHLISVHGARRIGCIAGPAALPVVTDRLAGWRRALRESGHPAPTEWIVHAEFDRRAGYHAAAALLMAGHELDGLFVGSDVQAMGALRAAADLGVSVPGDLPVVGFDGIAEGAYTTPSLTTVEQPVDDIAAAVVQGLLEGAGDPTWVRVLPTTLRVHESCGCVPTVTESPRLAGRRRAPARTTPVPARATPAPARATPARATPARGTPASARGTPASARATPAPARATPAPAHAAPTPTGTATTIRAVPARGPTRRSTST